MSQLTKKTKGKQVRSSERLNLRNPPTAITGIPQEVFLNYDITFVITGMNSIQPILQEKGTPRTPGRTVPYEELQRVCKAPGFVKSQDKEETKTASTLDALAFFSKVNAKSEPLVKEPKAYAKKVKEIDQNLKKSAVAIERGGDSSAGQATKLFAHVMKERAKSSSEQIIERQLQGEVVDEKKVYAEHGFPLSLKSKFITGSIDVAPAGKFWTSFQGKDFLKFSNLTVGEIRSTDPKLLRVFYEDDDYGLLKDGVANERLASYAGFKSWTEVPERIKEKILDFSFPIRPIIGNVDMLERYEANRDQPRLKNLAASTWKPLDVLYNTLIEKYYHYIPSNVLEVKPAWESLAGRGLLDPTVVSKSYRVQAIEALKLKPALHEKEEQRWKEAKDHLAILQKEEDKPFSICGNSVSSMFEAKVSETHADGSVVKFTRSYAPVSIVGAAKKKEKKKDRERRLRETRSELTAVSKHYVKGLENRKISPIVVTEVRNYLGSFLLNNMQEIAAKIVYITCELGEKESRKTLRSLDSDTDEEEENEDSEEPSLESEPELKFQLPEVTPPGGGANDNANDEAV